MRIIKFSLVAVVLLTISCCSSEKKGPKWSPAIYMSSTNETVLEAPPEKVFPLFCPVREYEYMRKWTCTMRYSRSGYAEKNAIFQSSYPLPFWMKATWICTKYEPNNAVSYTVFIPKIAILLVENTFEKLPDGNTKHTVAYSGFGLNWIGKILIKKMFSQDNKESVDQTIHKELEYYLKYNKKMPEGDK